MVTLTRVTNDSKNILNITVHQTLQIEGRSSQCVYVKYLVLRIQRLNEWHCVYIQLTLPLVIKCSLTMTATSE